MSEEPTLPRLPAVSWDEHSQSFSNTSRKRARYPGGGASSTFNSSDPAVFSSDDDPGLDNYVEGRRKKRYIGSWFQHQQHPTSSDSAFGEGPTIGPQPKRKLSRQVDSGVFLASDGAESDILENAEVPFSPQAESNTTVTAKVPIRPRLPQLERRPQISWPELMLRDKIRDYLDHRTDTIDAWSMGLEEISDKTIEMITQSSHFPQVDFRVKFGSREPELKLYLANNLLSRVPASICNIDCITVLTLRANRLKELPPSIAKLRNLRELSVSQNELRYLPSEFLELMELPYLRLLNLYPNPYLQPENAPAEPLLRYRFLYTLRRSSSESDTKPPMPLYVPRNIGRTPLQISTSTGTILSAFSLDAHAYEEKMPMEEAKDSLDFETLFTNRHSFTNTETTAVPSLAELALRSCYRSAELPFLASYLPEELGHLRPILDRVAEQKASGDIACSRCKKELIVPAFEWIEWDIPYDITMTGTVASRRPGEPAGVPVEVRPIVDANDMLPFRYRACSWRCAQSCLATRGERHGFRLKRLAKRAPLPKGSPEPAGY